MVPDVNLKSYYLQFISNANKDIIVYKESLEEANKIKEELYNYINDKETILNNLYGINLNIYLNEYVYKEYDTSEPLYQKTLRVLNNISVDDTNKIHLHQIIKYCGVLRSEYKYKTLIALAHTRKNMKYRAYSNYVMDYYKKVHKTVLEGMGYKFSNGIGTYCINHWKIDTTKLKTKKRIDFAATNAKKKELIAAGTKIYDDNEATWYKARKIPYNAVDHRVYKNESSFYDITFIKSNIFNTNNSVDYKRAEYVSPKFRGMSYTDIADKFCKTIDDVYNLQLDIKYKLNIILYKDPTKYLNFIRNAEQHKYKRGAHNS